MKDTAVFTVIFPAHLPFLPAFVNSLNQQSAREFQVVVANDGVNEPEKYFCDLTASLTIFNVSGTIAEIRNKALKFLSDQSYKYIVFADSDDCLSKDRVENLRGWLDRYSIVCNDIDLMDSEGVVFQQCYWTSRLGDCFEFRQDFIDDKNILGLGNTAVRASLLRSVKIPSHLMAPDWYLFYVLMQKQEALFTNQCTTQYRQHSSNIIGLKAVDEKRLRTIIDTKRSHYEALLSNGFRVEDLLQRTVEFERAMEEPEYRNRYLQLLNAQKINYFWWEEINYSYEKSTDQQG